MILAEGVSSRIKYTNKQDETSERRIIPAFVPSKNIKAIDVSDLTDDEAANIEQLLKQYAEYKSLFVSNMFNFEDFVQHTTGHQPSYKWRTFNIDNIQDV